MVLFDTLIKEVLNLLEEADARSLPLTEDLLSDAGKNNMVFASDKAYELGSHNSLSFELASSRSFVEDGITLIGEDLYEISEDRNFIRITLIKIKEIELSGNDLYNKLEAIRYTKYRVNPEGYMLRTATHDREKIRLSVNASKQSFSKIGSAYINAYKQIPEVEQVRVIFITNTEGLFEALKRIAERKNEITSTIDHILKGMALNDCGSCSAKTLCDEVEGLRQLHKGEN